ncbi:MAG: DUF1700 domain-containing protein [Clostridium sp.]
MNKEHFFFILKNNLKGFTDEEIQEILYDYEEHFTVGAAEGKSEEEIAKELGDPITIAKQYSESNKNNNTYTGGTYARNNGNVKVKSSSSENKKLLSMTILIVIGIVALGPITGLGGLLIGIFGIGIACTFGGLGLMIGGLTGTVSTMFFSSISLPLSSLIFIGIGTIALGVLILIGAVYLVKLLIDLSKRFYKFIYESLQ